MCQTTFLDANSAKMLITKPNQQTAPLKTLSTHTTLKQMAKWWTVSIKTAKKNYSLHLQIHLGSS